MQNEPILPSARWFLPNLYEAITRDLVIQRGDWAAFAKYPGTHNNQATQVKLNLDWKALELDSANAKLYAPAIAGMQTEKLWQPDNSISIAPKLRSIRQPMFTPATRRAPGALLPTRARG